jgi:hypothetical protein
VQFYTQSEFNEIRYMLAQLMQKRKTGLELQQGNCIWSFVARVGSSRCRSRINIGISEVCFSSKGGDFTPSVLMFDSGANPRAAQKCFSGSNFRTLIPNAIALGTANPLRTAEAA